MTGTVARMRAVALLGGHALARLPRQAAAPREHITLAEFEHGEYELRVPDFMDCVGEQYSPRWGEFHKLVVDWDEELRMAQLEGSEERLLAARFSGYNVAGFAEKIRNEWWPFLFDQDTSLFDLVIRGMTTKEAMAGFCLPGFVQAVWTRSSIMLEHAWAVGAEGMKNETLKDIGIALYLIGNDLRSDYLESTRWPVRGLWLLKTLEERRATKLVEWSDQLPPGEDDLPTSAGVDFYSMHEGGEVTDHALRASIFGLHAALMSEPISMLRAALPEWQIAGYWLFQKCRTNDPLHHYQCHVFCHVLAECNYNLHDNLPIRRLFTMIDLAAEGVGGDGPAPTIDEMLDVVGLFRTDPLIGNVDLFICTVPLLCSLLRGVFTYMPILGYFTMFSYGNPAKEHGAWALMHFAEMSKNAQQNAFAVGGLELAERWDAQMGVRLPVVRPFGLYVMGHAALRALPPNPFATLSREAGEYQRTVLVTRTPFTVVTTLLHAMRHYVEAVTPEFPLKFTVLKGPRFDSPDEYTNTILIPPAEGQTLQEALTEIRGVFIESQEFVRYRCAVFISHLPMQFTFNELYSMHVPVLTPTPRWLYKLLLQRNWLPFRGEGQKDRRMTVPGPPFVPDEVMGDPYHEFQYMYAKRDEARFPGVQMFGNFPELLELLLFSDMEAIREEMRMFNEKAFARAKHWYRGAALHLFR